ncbi:auxilin-related protein 1 [Senna tora]|uniref:Auxilin-related protein 1 n=1 Tax=Senna tora TaxID=362788 RepID=A0A834T1M5_9FABA|nr:auxilin-related protein 1 [Senna tora]
MPALSLLGGESGVLELPDDFKDDRFASAISSSPSSISPQRRQKQWLICSNATFKLRIAKTADIQIKQWAAGNESNMRALLSTLQYVLWAECGWQPVSLTDMITSVSVKKVYRKATLCIHPDKVQQKDASLEQSHLRMPSID